MKAFKKIFAVLSIIILAFVIGYLFYTGSRLSDVMREVNDSSTKNIAEGAEYE